MCDGVTHKQTSHRSIWVKSNLPWLETQRIPTLLDNWLRIQLIDQHNWAQLLVENRAAGAAVFKYPSVLSIIIKFAQWLYWQLQYLFRKRQWGSTGCSLLNMHNRKIEVRKRLGPLNGKNVDITVNTIVPGKRSLWKYLPVLWPIGPMRPMGVGSNGRSRCELISTPFRLAPVATETERN